MLLAIRDRISGVLAWVIIILICIPFGLWGIQEYFGYGQDSYALVVNGEEVSKNNYNRLYSNNREALMRSFGGRLPAFFDDAEFLRKQTLDVLTEQELLKQLANKNGFRVSAATVVESIMSIPSFQKDGKFDQETYTLQMKSAGQSTAGFEQDIRDQIVLNQIRQGVSSTAFVSQKTLTQQAKIKYQTRDISYITLPIAAYNKDIGVSDSEINEYYENNKNTLLTEEQLSVEFIELNLNDIAGGIAATEETLLQVYQDAEKTGGYMTSEETRNASHILIRIPQDASELQIEEKHTLIQALLERARGGESFADIAKQASEDPGSATQGGSLGDVSRGVMVKPFEDALFSMKTGEISEPIKTTFGYHLIQLHSINSAKKIPFEQVRDQIEQDYRQKEAENIFYKQTDLLSSKAFENPDSLEPAAEATELEIKSSAHFTRKNGEGIARFAQVRESAFSDEILGAGINSELIELESNHVVIIRRKDHLPSREKTLDEAREDIKSALLKSKVENHIKTAAEKLKEAILKSGISDSLVGQVKGELKSEKELKRNTGEVPFEILTEAFKIVAPKDESTPAVSMVRMDDGSYAVIELKSVEDGDIAWVDAEEKDRLRKQLIDANSVVDMSNVMASLKAKANIVVNLD